MKRTSLPFPYKTIARDLAIDIQKFKELTENKFFIQPLVELMVANVYKADLHSRKDGGGKYLQKGKGDPTLLIDKKRILKERQLGTFLVHYHRVILYNVDLDKSMIYLESMPTTELTRQVEKYVKKHYKAIEKKLKKKYG